MHKKTSVTARTEEVELAISKYIYCLNIFQSIDQHNHNLTFIILFSPTELIFIQKRILIQHTTERHDEEN